MAAIPTRVRNPLFVVRNRVAKLDIQRQRQKGSRSLIATPACRFDSIGQGLELALGRHLAIDPAVGMFGGRGRSFDHGEIHLAMFSESATSSMVPINPSGHGKESDAVCRSSLSLPHRFRPDDMLNE